MHPKVVFGIVFSTIAIIAIGIAVTYSRSGQTNYTGLDDFAKCLSEKQVVMYGAAWCSHCQAQKKLFGESFKYVSYVECPENPQKCLDANVNSYPNWVFPDGRHFEGEQSLEELSKLSGCPLR